LIGSEIFLIQYTQDPDLGCTFLKIIDARG